MFCSDCGKEVHYGDKYCKSCGKEINYGYSSCGSCGHRINFGDKFCAGCGDSLSNVSNSERGTNIVPLTNSNIFKDSNILDSKHNHNKETIPIVKNVESNMSNDDLNIDSQKLETNEYDSELVHLSDSSRSIKPTVHKEFSESYDNEVIFEDDKGIFSSINGNHKKLEEFDKPLGLSSKEDERDIIPIDHDKSSYFSGGLFDLIVTNIASRLILIFTFGFGLTWAVAYKYRWETNNTVINGRKLKFTGSGGDLLGQYIKWFLLSIITIGIYGFTIPIKLEKWKARNTFFVDDKTNIPSSFSGNTLGLIGLNITNGILNIITLSLALPWTISRKHRFFAQNRVINGYTVKFTGSGGQIIGNYIKWVLLSLVTFGIFLFWIPIKLKQWVIKNTRLKATPNDISKDTNVNTTSCNNDYISNNNREDGYKIKSFDSPEKALLAGYKKQNIRRPNYASDKAFKFITLFVTLVLSFIAIFLVRGLVLIDIITLIFYDDYSYVVNPFTFSLYVIISLLLLVLCFVNFIFFIIKKDGFKLNFMGIGLLIGLTILRFVVDSSYDGDTTIIILFVLMIILILAFYSNKSMADTQVNHLYKLSNRELYLFEENINKGLMISFIILIVSTIVSIALSYLSYHPFTFLLLSLIQFVSVIITYAFAEVKNMIRINPISNLFRYFSIFFTVGLITILAMWPIEFIIKKMTTEGNI